MRFQTDTYVHVYNRGNRKQPIVRDAKDKWHFLQALYYLNHQKSMTNPFRELRELLKAGFNNSFIWPQELGDRAPLVQILSFKLMGNHLHLILRPKVENGIPIFMQRVGTTMAKWFNERHQEVGRLFQGRYKGRIVETDEYIMYLSVYIQVKNAFEEYPGGFKQALQKFDRAYERAAHDPYNSLGDYAGYRNSPIVDKDVLGRIFPTPKSYKDFAKQCILRSDFEESLGVLRFDE